MFVVRGRELNFVAMTGFSSKAVVIRNHNHDLALVTINRDRDFKTRSNW